MSKPKPVKTDSRICFGISYFKTEADALAFAKGGTGYYNGGFFHGEPCGRASSHDHVDPEHGKLYAVTTS